MPAITDDTILPFSFPAVHAKKVTAAFDGGRLTSNGGVMLLAMTERRLGLADNLALVFPDWRDAGRAQPCRYVPRSHVRDLLRLRGRRRPRSSAVRSGVQARLRSAAGHGPGFVFATDAVAAGEFAATARRDPPDLHLGRRMDG